MKKVISLLLAACMCFVLAVAITSCNEPSTDTPKTEDHEHTYATEWSSDATHHWHACETEGCTETADKAEHEWDEGSITTPATSEKEGTKTYKCEECGATKNESVAWSKWQAYFDYAQFQNVTVTSVLTDSAGARDETSIKIDGDKWERYFLETMVDLKYYDECVVYYDGESKYINGEPAENCTVNKEAFFSFISFSDKAEFFTETSAGRYESGESSFKIYGFSISNAVVVVENDLLRSITLQATMSSSVITLEYEFLDWGTTEIAA